MENLDKIVILSVIDITIGLLFILTTFLTASIDQFFREYFILFFFGFVALACGIIGLILKKYKYMLISIPIFSLILYILTGILLTL